MRYFALAFLAFSSSVFSAEMQLFVSFENLLVPKNRESLPTLKVSAVSVESCLNINRSREQFDTVPNPKREDVPCLVMTTDHPLFKKIYYSLYPQDFYQSSFEKNPAEVEQYK